MAVKFTARAAGVLRIEAAMAHIAEARREIEHALRDLCSINGAIVVSRDLREALVTVKSVRIELADEIRRFDDEARMKLDRDPIDEDRKPHARGCGCAKWKPRG